MIDAMNPSGYFKYCLARNLRIIMCSGGQITGMKPQSPENSGETYSAADLRVRQAGLRGIKPSAFGGIVRLENFISLNS